MICGGLSQKRLGLRGLRSSPVVIAEPNALVGFAGPRVIRETVREELPEGFQRGEFLLRHGNVDLIADRREMREVLARIVALLTKAPARETEEN